MVSVTTRMEITWEYTVVSVLLLPRRKQSIITLNVIYSMSLTEPFPCSPQMGITLTEKSRLSFSQAPTGLEWDSSFGSALEWKPGCYREFFCLPLPHTLASLYQFASGLSISTFFPPLPLPPFKLEHTQEHVDFNLTICKWCKWRDEKSVNVAGLK